ncbi:MAG: VOC family protein [Actinomycetota bacterium]|nr:VOC family protein [Actinomycetota bacterium]
MTGQTSGGPVLQLRLVLETEDLDAALAFYRDALGLPELKSYSGDGGARVAILGIPTATLELANPAQVAMIDEVEVGRAVAHPFPFTVRVAFEVADAAASTTALVSAGADPVAPPTRTPWNSLNARIEAPGGMQLTVFQELGERATEA